MCGYYEKVSRNNVYRKNSKLAKPRNHSGSTSILNSTTNNTLKCQLPKLRETGISSENTGAQRGRDVSSPVISATKISAHFGDNNFAQMSRRLNGRICSHTPSALNAGAKRSDMPYGHASMLLLGNKMSCKKIVYRKKIFS